MTCVYICGRCPWKCRTDDPKEHHVCLDGKRPFFSAVYKRPPQGKNRPSP